MIKINHLNGNCFFDALLLIFLFLQNKDVNQKGSSERTLRWAIAGCSVRTGNYLHDRQKSELRMGAEYPEGQGGISCLMATLSITVSTQSYIRQYSHARCLI